jgi:peptide-methionine (R)-S-oxide reductase
MPDKIEKPEAQWREELTPDQYRILREKGTERAGTGELLNEKRDGVFICAGCGQPLYPSDAKFDSGTGWPSFSQPVSDDALQSEEDRTLGMMRTEVMCGRCGGHLGHVFPDGPQPTGMRHCINSASLKFEPKG